MDLPPDWILDRPAAADVAALTALVRASDVAALGYPDSGEEDVVEALAGTHTTPARDHWLVRDAAGEVRGWAYLDSRQGGARETAEVFVLPGRGEPATGPLLGLLVRRAAERAAAAGRPSTTLRAWAIPSEVGYLAALREAGFAEVKRYARMRGPLDPLPVVAAEGVAVRPVRAGDDADMREFQAVLDEAFRDTEDYEAEPYDNWRRRIAALPRIDWDEWLVAECGGAVAGVLQSAPPSTDTEGWVRNLAVRRPYRGRGVAKALLAAAFAVYAGKGRTHAGLGVDLTNPTEPYRLYRAVGMTPAYEAVAMQREVP